MSLRQGKYKMREKHHLCKKKTRDNLKIKTKIEGDGSQNKKN